MGLPSGSDGGILSTSCTNTLGSGLILKAFLWVGAIPKDLKHIRLGGTFLFSLSRDSSKRKVGCHFSGVEIHPEPKFDPLGAELISRTGPPHADTAYYHGEYSVKQLYPEYGIRSQLFDVGLIVWTHSLAQ